jgi:hypothetical protein
MFTLGLTTLFGMMGLVTDFGYAYYRKEVAQAAAQSAAVAAVRAAIAQSGGTCGTNNTVCQSETVCPAVISGTGTTNIDKGCLYAIANGFTSTGKQKVTIQSGSGAYNGVTVNYWAVVKVSEQLPQLFSVVTGNTTATLTARSVVGYIPVTNGGCVYVTAPSGASLTTNGNTSLSSGCGVVVDSNDPTNAINLSGGNTTITVTGTTNGQPNEVDVRGGTSCYGQTTGCISPMPTQISVNPGDPMSGIDAPTDPGTCDVMASSLNYHGQGATISPTGSVTKVCGVISPGNNEKVIFQSGTYYFRDGININNGDISGTGVTFYFPAGSSVSMAGNGNIDLHAPTGGPYQGVLMFQARDNTTAATITGNGSSRVEGVLYFPSAQVMFGGNGTSVNNSGTTSIVAFNLQLKGNSSYIQGPANSPYLNTFSGYAILE